MAFSLAALLPSRVREHLVSSQYAALQGRDVVRSSHILKAVALLPPDPLTDRVVVRRHARLLAHAAGTSDEEALRALSASAGSGRVRRIAAYLYAEWPGDCREQTRRLAAYIAANPRGYWSVEAAIRVAQNELLYLGDPQAAEAAARLALRAGATRLQRSELTIVIQAAEQKDVRKTR